MSSSESAAFQYAWAVKQNQPTLYERVEEAIGAGLEQDASALDEYQTAKAGHGRRRIADPGRHG